MMSLFTQDSTAAMATARALFEAATAKVSELETARVAALANTEIASIDEIQRIDTELEAHRHAASIYHERIEALGERLRTEDRARREEEKIAAIAEIGRRVARRNATAIQLDEAIEAVRAAVAKLDRADEAVFANWPAILPLAGVGYLNASANAALAERFSDARDHTIESRMIIGPVRGIAKNAPFGLAEAIQTQGRDLIGLLQDAPLPKSDDEETSAAAAA